MKLLSRLFLMMVLLASLISLFLPVETNLNSVLSAPSLRHWLGTDGLGRDYGLRILQGFFLSLAVGSLGVFVAGFIGIIVGAWVGWKKGWIDFAWMRAIEIWDSVPSLVLVTLFIILFRGLWGESPLGSAMSVSLGMASVHWISFARLTRILVMQESQAPWIEGARVIGVSPWKLIWNYLRPNLQQSLLQNLWAQITIFVLFESHLSFLGFGFQPPLTSLGVLMQEGWRALSVSPVLLLAPGGFLVLILLAFQRAFDFTPLYQEGKLALLNPPKADSRATAAERHK